MDRRLILSSLVLVPAAALATQAIGAASAMPEGKAETDHAEQTAKVGSLSLATSRIAVQRASGAEVKKFAGFEVAEQETVADILASMKKAAEEAKGALVVPSDAQVQAMLDADGKAMLDKLNALSGGAFDKAYVQGQVDGHNKLLVIQEDYLKVGKNREHLDVAKLARGMIKEHLQHLADLTAA